MYSEYSLAPTQAAHAQAQDVGIREINSQNITQNPGLPYIRQGLNGPAIAIAVPTHPHMAQSASHTHHHQQQQSQQHQPRNKDKDRINVLATPSSTVLNGQLVIGDADSVSERSYTPVKNVGNGSFGTVWLCDWHTQLPPTVSLAHMQQGPGAKPEWQGKRLVAIKRMKKRWDGGWDECRRHPELESLRTIPPHENVIPLYDCFILPTTKELYFVFECMEGNLYQLIKSRKGRPLAGGLVSSIFYQTCRGLAHTHDAGYFHRDMKPENLLVTTTGLTDYTPVSPLAPPGAPPEKDVVVIIKLADFGLARLIKSKPPYTEYVSTRWYRAPEVLLQSTDYNAPVDLWALGTIMAEVVNLKPLFPGNNGQDQLQRICQVLGDPSDVYGFDSHGRPRGGGKWSRGLKMAKHTGLVFEKIQPLDFWSLFDPSVPHSLIDCIHSLLRYEPEARLTAHGCLQHLYFQETAPRSTYAPLNMSRRHLSSAGSGNSASSRTGPLAAVTPREIPHSHSRHQHQHHHSHHHHHPYSNGNTNSHRHPFVPTQAYSGDLDMTPADGIVEVDRNNVPIRQYPSHQRQNTHPDQMVLDPPGQMDANNPVGKTGVFGLKKLASVFGHQDNKPMNLQPVEEMTFASRSTPSLKETPSTSSESRSLPELMSGGALHGIPPPVAVPPPLPPPMNPKQLKKEQERLAREAEKERRANIERMHRERARAVVRKRETNDQARKPGFEYQNVTSAKLASNTQPAPRPKTTKIKDDASVFSGMPPSVLAANSYGVGEKGSINALKQQRGLQAANSGMSLGAYEHRTKRRKEDDDEQSMSSSDVQSVGRMSVISFATVDSDPGPNRSLRRRPSAYNGNGYGLSPRPHGTATSISSLQSYTNSPRSSHSVEPGIRSNNSLDAQFLSDFEARATFAAVAGNPLYSPQSHVGTQSQHGPNGLVDGMSPPSMQFLTLSGSPSHPPWTLESNGDQGSTDGNSVSTLGSRRVQHTMVYGQGMSPGHVPNTSFEYFGQSRSHPPTPHSVNPAFQVNIPPVPPLPATSHVPAGNSLPSFSTLISSMGDIQGMQQPQPLETVPHHQDHPP